MKRIAVLIIMMMWAWSLFAHPQLAYNRTDKGEGDSLGLKIEDGKTYMRYRMGSGETIMMVCRKYNTSLASVVSANPGINPDLVKAGQVIFVPRNNIASNTTTTSNSSSSGSSTATKAGNYTVNPGETLTGICNKFNVSLSQVLAANPGLNADQLKVGQSIYVPGAGTSSAQTTTIGTTSTAKETYSGATSSHAIATGETLYSIARNYSISFSQLMAANPDIQPDKLYPGQVIRIPVKDGGEDMAQVKKEEPAVKKEEPVIMKEEPVVQKEEPAIQKEEPKVWEEPVAKKEEPAVKQEEPVVKKEEPVIKKEEPVAVQEAHKTDDTPAGNAMNDADSGNIEVANGNNMLLTAGRLDKDKTFAQVFAEYAGNSYDASSEKGVATWIEGDNTFGTNNERFYALHNNAPIGSVIKVRNMMNNRVIYAKVIGTLSEEEVNDKVLVKLTSGAAEKLNVLDTRFVSEITFYKVGKEFLR